MSFERFLDERNINARTRTNYLQAFKRVRPLEYPDLVSRFKELEKEYAFSTVQFDKRVVKAFLRWRGDGEKVEWIKPREYNVAKEVMDALIDNDEMQRLLDACDHPRDKAMIAVAWETGVRLSELLAMTLKDGERTSYGWKWLIAGKRQPRRGKTVPRSVWLIRSAPLVSLWLSVHPKRKDKTSPLWVVRCKTRVNGIGESRARAILKGAAKRAGLTRRVWWHMFRHNAASRDAKDQNGKPGMTEAALRVKYGWSKTSRMPSIYVHLFGKDIEQIVLSREGITEVSKTIEDVFLKPKKCFGCGHTNPGDAGHCLKCGLVLDEKEARELSKKQEFFDLIYEYYTKYPEKLEEILKGGEKE